MFDKMANHTLHSKCVFLLRIYQSAFAVKASAYAHVAIKWLKWLK